ncbi:MAG: carboxypeptidase-like regulatory domain-containing protein [Planctomycetota bacterium]
MRSHGSHLWSVSIIAVLIVILTGLADGRSEAAGQETGTTQARARIVLRGRLNGLDDRLPWRATISVVPIEQVWEGNQVCLRRNEQVGLSAAVSKDGLFDVELTPLVGVEPRVARLEIVADDPGYEPLQATVFMPDARVCRGEQPIDVTIDVRVSACGALTGRVVREDKAPVNDAPVAAVERVSGKPAERAVASTRCAAVGTFHLRVDREAEVFVVAFANGWMPAATVATVAVAKTQSVDDLVLERGAAISGTVTWAGAPLPGARLAIRPELSAWDAPLVQIKEPPLAWFNGEFLHSRATASTDSTGRFCCTGLRPGFHTLEIQEAFNAWVIAGEETVNSRQANAPTEEADIELEAALVELQASAGGATVDDCHLFVGGEWGGMILRSPPPGSLFKYPALFVPPHCQLNARASTTSLASVQQNFVSPGNGERHLETLEMKSQELPAPVKRHLVLRLTDEWGEPITRAAVDLEVVARSSRRSSGVSDLKASEEGLFRVACPRLGRQWVRVRPEGSGFQHDSYFRELIREVDVPEEGEVELEATAVLGGRLMLSVLNERGDPVEAPCSIVASDGEPCLVKFVTPSVDSVTDRLAGWSSSDDKLARGLTHVDPVLQPGRYEIRLSYGDGGEKMVPVVIEAGRSTVLEVVLEERSGGKQE